MTTNLMSLNCPRIWQDFDFHDCGPKPDRSKLQKTRPPTAKVEKTKDEDDKDIERDDGHQALTECQNQRFRSEAFPGANKRADRRRPLSLDLNNTGSNAMGSSPRLRAMKKKSLYPHRSSAFPSPGTPDYRQIDVGIPKGWSSERVPLPTNSNRRLVIDALLPFNNGRALPSKWEDAEKWISSPALGDLVGRVSVPLPQRRPKSKSGPLGPPGTAYYSTYSPAMPMFDSAGVANFTMGSPFSAGVMMPEALSLHYGGGSASASGGISCLGVHTGHCIARSATVHGCSDLLDRSSMPGSQDEKLDGTKDAETTISHVASIRNMATQMSPEGSAQPSPKGRHVFAPSSSPSILPIVEIQHCNSYKLEIKDVEVDKRVTLTSWSKKHRAQMPEKGSGNIDELKNKAVNGQTSAWLKREKARITAWEDLQKAKAEAEIQELEMKLERKRSSSMGKIMNKLRSAQRKAQEMRSMASASEAYQVAWTPEAISFRKTGRIHSLRSCFTCTS